MEATGPQNATEIEGMRGQHGEEIEAQRRQMRSEMAEWSGRQQAEVEALKEAHAKVEQALRAERDKAAKDLARLKQHLLHIEREESDKAEAEAAKVAEMEQRIAALEMEILALQQNNARLASELEHRGKAEKDEESRLAADLRDAQGQLAVLREELAAMAATSVAREEELSNLQATLGQFYAESDAKNNLASEARTAREEVARLTKELQAEREAKGLSDNAAAVAEAKAAKAEERVAQAVARQQKWEAEVGKLRKALEESMLRLHQLSTESGFYVDRRIVVKLLLTYFERQYSKDALDLMAKMLGFTEEEKHRVNEAASRMRGGVGVVRGVFNLPGKLVGLLPKAEAGGDLPGSPSGPRSDGTSFSDMWIEFLLKESEERDRRELQRRMGDAEGGAASSAALGEAAGPTAGMPPHSAGSAGGDSGVPGGSSGTGPGPSGTQAAGPSAGARERGAGGPSTNTTASSPPKLYTNLPIVQPDRGGTPGKPPLSYDLTAATRSRTPSPTPLAHEMYSFNAHRPSPGASTLGSHVPHSALPLQPGPASGAVPGVLGGVTGPSGVPGVRRALIPPGPAPGVPGGRDDRGSTINRTSSVTSSSTRGVAGGGQLTEGESFFPPVNGVRAVHGVPKQDGDESSEDFSPVPLHGILSGEGGGPSLFDSFRIGGKGKEETPLPL